MSDEEDKKKIPWVLIVVLAALAGGGVYLVKAVLSEDAPRKRNETPTITLLKPPPMPEIKEKPPEPIQEVQKQEEIVDPTQTNEPKSAENDNTPAGDKLGVDAEGGAGSDGFGLVGKKGGRSLLAGGDGMGKISLLSRFAGYTQLVTNQVKKKVMTHLDEDGGIPKGQFQAVVRLTVNADGDVIGSKIVGSSGNNRMDEAVRQALVSVKVSEPPPDGMPRTMVIRITSQG